VPVGRLFAILRSLKREVELGPVRREEPRAHPLGQSRVPRSSGSRSSRSGWAITFLAETDPHAFRVSRDLMSLMHPSAESHAQHNAVGSSHDGSMCRH
jgi:hypothetical protein